MKETIEHQNIHTNRQYKSSLFCMVFKDKKDLIDLYNAVNDTNYTNPEDLEINTLENVIYMSMKNDTSFLVGFTMNLYEHQSTKNANMPLRGFLYFARLFETYVDENGLDIYSSTMQKLPTPKYIVFYNGKENEADERILRLSDAFIKEGGCLECEARLLNINYGRNRELMEKCRRLEEYAIFIARVRQYMGEEQMPLKQAITLAMEQCIEDGILEDILRKQRDEVLGVLLTTFNKELHEKCLKEDAFAEGFNNGFKDGYKDGISAGKDEGARENRMNLLKIKLAKGKSLEQIADELEESVEEIEKLIEHLNVKES